MHMEVASRKRPIDIAFPELADELRPMTWRDPDIAGDWKVSCGSKEFIVHRIIVMRGPRASLMLRSSSDTRYEAQGTDLSRLLPQECWELVEMTCDYMYGADFKPAASRDVVRALKVADVMQIKPLFDECVERLNDIVENQLQELPSLLQLAWDMLPGAVTSGILQQTAKHFFVLQHIKEDAERLRALPCDALVQLLGHEQLRIGHEDEVAQFLLLASGQPWTPLNCESVPEQLWPLVRIEHLSPQVAGAIKEVVESSTESAVWQQMVLSLLRRREAATPDRASPAIAPPLDVTWMVPWRYRQPLSGSRPWFVRAFRHGGMCRYESRMDSGWIRTRPWQIARFESDVRRTNFVIIACEANGIRPHDVFFVSSDDEETVQEAGDATRYRCMLSWKVVVEEFSEEHTAKMVKFLGHLAGNMRGILLQVQVVQWSQ
eukprot:TRINITY_DN91807_c0_g1_i1.p1 TRINITY_DN91807_c0_g1~~TRINITY_DN91807_c0_g1_i1.p1  ORF type:complete len:433 (-),score=45.13 TRINITY_DN91807_c0_g1_i1:3-1301(-)